MNTSRLHDQGMPNESAVSTESEVDILRLQVVQEQQPSESFANGAPASKEIMQSSTRIDAAAIPDTHCRETGLSHTNLLEFGIRICPKCNGIIQNDGVRFSQAVRSVSKEVESVEPVAMVKEVTNGEVLNLLGELSRGVESLAAVAQCWRQERDEAKAKREAGEKEEAIRAQAEEAAETKDSGEEKSAKEVAADNFIHQIEFRDEADVMLGRETRKAPLDILEVKQAPVGGAVAIISNIIKTNIPEDRFRNSWDSERIMKAGILGNPNVEVISFRQTMQLKSVPLIKVLQRVVKYYPGINLQGQELYLDAPFHLLAHHMPELKKFRDLFVPNFTTIAQLHASNDEVTTPKSGSVIRNTEEDEHSEITLRHVDTILKFMRTDYIYSQELEEELARHSLDQPLCTFSMLWLLYKPGTTVYVSSSAGVEAFVISKVEADSSLYERSNFTMEPTTISLTLWHLTFDGTFVRRQTRYEIIGSFEGPRPIADLKVVPAAFADKVDQGKTRDWLVQLGRKWYGLLRGAPQQHYVGETMGHGRRKKASDANFELSKQIASTD
jgi:hypothetical protein